MGPIIVRRLWILLLGPIFCLQAVSAQEKVLDIQPVFQVTPVYCWLATGQMVFEHFGIPANNPTLFSPSDLRNYQCGEAKGIGAVPTLIPSGPLSFTGICWNNCGLPQCMTGSGTIHGIYNLITQYPQIVARTNGNDKFFPHPIEATSPLSVVQLKTEIDAGRPIIAGISPGMQYLPPGISEHAVLIVGYADGGATVLVNDPFPYDSAHMMPSYLQVGGQETTPGQFRVPYPAMIGAIAWKNTIYNLETNGTSHANTGTEPTGGGDAPPANALSCTIDSTSTPWNPPGAAQVRIDGKSIGSFNFGPGGSSSLDFSCKAGHHHFQFSIPGTMISCTGYFDVDDDNTDFSPSMRVSPYGQVTCSLE
jgi:Peptidase_C39 like family